MRLEKGLGRLAGRLRAPSGRRGGFLCELDPHGMPSIRHGRSFLPVDGGFLRVLLAEAGLRLKPGQSLPLDVEVVKFLVEEALLETRDREAELRRLKKNLLSAYLAAESAN